MEPDPLGARGGCARPPCRNFARGFCRWGRSCRFSHDSKQDHVCRYFQSGFCSYGEQCSYEHIREELRPVGSHYGPVSPRHWDSEPGSVARSSGRPRHGSAHPDPSVMHEAFKLPNVKVEEEGTRKYIPAHDGVRRRTVGRESVPARARGASGSQLQGLGLASNSLDPREVMVETSTWTGSAKVPKELGAAAAPVPTSLLRTRSEAMVCGICMDRVYEKALPEERLFGILPNCSHTYCVGCIREWRRSRDFQSGVVKACPECRVVSGFYIPHKYWVSDVAEKEKLIKTFKTRMGKIRCKFFVRGFCPFKSECIYLHELPAGRPRRRRRQRPRMPVFSPLPSESSDEEDEDLEWAFTLSPMESDFWYMKYGHELLFTDFSDSD